MMKTSVILNESLIRKYYFDKYLVKYLFIDIIILFFGSTAAGIYFLGEKKLVAFCLEGLTIFFALVIYFLNRNEMMKTINENTGSEREYIFEFDDDKVTIKDKNIVKEIKYEHLVIKNYPHMFILKENKKEDKIYLLLKENIKKTEWNSILKKIKEARRNNI